MSRRPGAIADLLHAPWPDAESVSESHDRCWPRPCLAIPDPVGSREVHFAEDSQGIRRDSALGEQLIERRHTGLWHNRLQMRIKLETFEQQDISRSHCCQRALLASNIEIVSTETVPFEDQSYGEVISRNVAAARARTRPRMSQSALAGRMRALGYSWYPQTVGAVERGERRLDIGELLAAAFALETSVGALLDPSADDPFVELPSGQRVQVGTVQRSVRHFNDGMVWWENDEPRFESAMPGGREWPDDQTGALESFDTAENWRHRAGRIGPRPLMAADVPPPPSIEDRP